MYSISSISKYVKSVPKELVNTYNKLRANGRSTKDCISILVDEDLPHNLFLGLYGRYYIDNIQLQNYCATQFSVPAINECLLNGRAVAKIIEQDIQMLCKIKHPYILAPLNQLTKSNKRWSFTTKQLYGTIGHLASKLNLLDIINGVKCILSALSFIHNTLNIIHANLNMNSIYVNVEGNWVLGGFGLHINKNSTTSNSIAKHCLYYSDHNYYVSTTYSYQYTHPDLYRNNYSDKCDLYSLGLITAECLLIYYKVDLQEWNNLISKSSDRSKVELILSLIKNTEAIPYHAYELIHCLLNGTNKINNLPIVAQFSSLTELNLNNFEVELLYNKTKIIKSIIEILGKNSQLLVSNYLSFGKILPILENVFCVELQLFQPDAIKLISKLCDNNATAYYNYYWNNIKFYLTGHKVQLNIILAIIETIDVSLKLDSINIEQWMNFVFKCLQIECIELQKSMLMKTPKIFKYIDEKKELKSIIYNYIKLPNYSNQLKEVAFAAIVEMVDMLSIFELKTTFVGIVNKAICEIKSNSIVVLNQKLISKLTKKLGMQLFIELYIPIYVQIFTYDNINIQLYNDFTNIISELLNEYKSNHMKLLEKNTECTDKFELFSNFTAQTNESIEFNNKSYSSNNTNNNAKNADLLIKNQFSNIVENELNIILSSENLSSDIISEIIPNK